MVTRWCSTLFIYDKYLKFLSEITNAVEKIFADKVEFRKLTPEEHLTASELNILRSVASILKSAECETQILGCDK